MKWEFFLDDKRIEDLIKRNHDEMRRISMAVKTKRKNVFKNKRKLREIFKDQK
jgi:hypothetical protein